MVSDDAGTYDGGHQEESSKELRGGTLKSSLIGLQNGRFLF